MSHYSIVGFGNAGFQAALAIREREPDASIHVYTDLQQPPSNPMLTTYYVKGALAYDGIFPYGDLGSVLRQSGVVFHPHKKVTKVLPQTRELLFEDGLIEPYRKLLLATGASAFVPNTQGMNLPGVFAMRTPEDATRFKNALERDNIRSVLVVGASMVGIKIVELADLRGLPCTLIDGAGYMFPLAAFPGVAQRIQNHLTGKGVRLAFSALLSKIEEVRGDALKEGRLTATMSDGRTFTADAVVVCIGTRANTALVQESGIQVNRGILVDRKMRTSAADVYAAGDCCQGYELQFKEQRVIGLWANAGYQGRTAGTNMAGGSAEFDYTILHNISHFMGLDFLGFGDATCVLPEDEIYEHDAPGLYLRAAKGQDGRVKCINMLGGASISGIIKNQFMKSMTGSGSALDDTARGVLLSSGVPGDFIIFLGGAKHGHRA